MEEESNVTTITIVVAMKMMVLKRLAGN